MGCVCFCYGYWDIGCFVVVWVEEDECFAASGGVGGGLVLRKCYYFGVGRGRPSSGLPPAIEYIEGNLKNASPQAAGGVVY